MGIFSKIAKGFQDIVSPVIGTIIVGGGSGIGLIQSITRAQGTSRRLTDEEKAQVKRVFRESINLSVIRIIEGHSGIFGINKRPFVLGNTIYMKKPTFSTGTFIHEATHIWQYQNTGSRYASDALGAQFFVDDAYNWEKEIRDRGKNMGADQGDNLKDMGILTGAYPFIKAAGDTFDNMQIEDLGGARRVWADRHNFGIVGGKGDTRKLREHIAHLRAAYDRTDDPAAREKLQQRIGRLMGGSAVLWVGGTTESELEARKELAKRTAGAMRGAVRGGILPGGGVAMLNCRPAIQKLLEQSTDTDERAAYGILLKALETPVRTIIANAGYDAGDLTAEIRQKA